MLRKTFGPVKNNNGSWRIQWNQETKLNSNIKSVLLYGCETWEVTKDITTRLQTFIKHCLRYIMRIWWPKTISNIDLWEATSQSTIQLQIKRRKSRWIGHTLRRPPQNIARQALNWNPQGSCRRGRPRNT